jgi:hypothetical protein
MKWFWWRWREDHMSNKKNVLVLALLGTLLLLGACASTRQCPPNEPIIKFKEVPRPYPVLIQLPTLEPLVLPDYPMHPGHDADEVELKHWALETERVDKERDALKDARIKALEETISTHNRFIVEPVVPEPPG